MSFARLALDYYLILRSGNLWMLAFVIIRDWGHAILNYVVKMDEGYQILTLQHFAQDVSALHNSKDAHREMDAQQGVHHT